MSHFLFIRNEPSIPKTLREAFSAPECRIVIRTNATQAESALARGAFDSVVIYSDAGFEELERTVGEVKALAPGVFTIVLAPTYALEEEQAAFKAGADLYFSEPIPTRTLARVLSNTGSAGVTTPEPSATKHASGTEHSSKTAGASSTLGVLRDLSHILSYSLDYKAFTQHFILKLRDHISFSRIGIFLESSAKQSLVKNTRSKHLTCVASLGLPSDLVDCFQLSREVGIGKELSEQPRILRRGGNTRAPFAHAGASVEKEFAILGCYESPIRVPPSKEKVAPIRLRCSPCRLPGR